MPIDNVNKRASTLGSGLSFLTVLPKPSTSSDVLNRQQTNDQFTFGYDLWSLSVSETGLLGETLAGGRSLASTISEGIVLSDTEDSIIVITAGLLEGIFGGDSNSSQAAFAASSTDGGLLGDTKVAFGNFGFGITEGAISGDSQTNSKTVYATITEGNLSGDSLAITVLFSEALTEGLLGGNEQSPQVSYVATILEGGLLSEELRVTKRTFSRRYNVPLPYEPIEIADKKPIVKATKLPTAPPATKLGAAPPPERKRSTQNND